MDSYDKKKYIDGGLHKSREELMITYKRERERERERGETENSEA